MESLGNYSGLSGNNLHAQREAFNALLQKNNVLSSHLMPAVEFNGSSRGDTLLNTVNKVQYKVSALRHVHEFGLTPLQVQERPINDQLNTRVQLAQKQLTEKYAVAEIRSETDTIVVEIKDSGNQVTFMAIGKIIDTTFEIFHKHEVHEYGNQKYDSTVFEKIGEYADLPPGYRRDKKTGGIYKI